MRDSAKYTSPVAPTATNHDKLYKSSHVFARCPAPMVLRNPGMLGTQPVRNRARHAHALDDAPRRHAQQDARRRAQVEAVPVPVLRRAIEGIQVGDGERAAVEDEEVDDQNGEDGARDHAVADEELGEVVVAVGEDLPRHQHAGDGQRDVAAWLGREPPPSQPRQHTVGWRTHRT